MTWTYLVNILLVSAMGVFGVTGRAMAQWEAQWEKTIEAAR